MSRAAESHVRADPIRSAILKVMMGFPIHPAVVVAALLTLLPFLLAAFGQR